MFCSTSKPDSSKEVDYHVSEDVPLAVAPDDGVELPAQETEGFTREKKRYRVISIVDFSMSLHLLLKKCYCCEGG